MEKKITKVVHRQSSIVNRKRVAAYARVSSGKNAMLESLSAQVSYYSNLIQNKPHWSFAGVYADEAQTGTKQDRPQFQQLIADCKSGKIDMIITKAISRFARNTVTTLQYVRELRELGISVYFEEENIDTLSEGGELMLTVLSAFAQEQSFNVSEDCKWRISKQFKQGEMPMCQQKLYGYKRTADGGYEIVEYEANIIRRIFTRYLEGAGLIIIARELNDCGIPSPHGKQWNINGLRYVLTNERAVGDLRLQKFYVVDHISKHKKINNGEKDQFYIENNHPAIISREIFNAVQDEIKCRSQKFKAGSEPQKAYEYTGKIVCGLCGKNFKRRTNPTKITWQCDTYLTHGKNVCPAKQIPETALEELIQGRTVNKIIAYPGNKVEIEFTDCTLHSALCATWHDRSRRDSWTDEMKQSARNKRLEQLGREQNQ